MRRRSKRKRRKKKKQKKRRRHEAKPTVGFRGQVKGCGSESLLLAVRLLEKVTEGCDKFWRAATDHPPLRQPTDRTLNLSLSQPSERPSTRCASGSIQNTCKPHALCSEISSREETSAFQHGHVSVSEHVVEAPLNCQYLGCSLPGCPPKTRAQHLVWRRGCSAED